MRSGGAAESRQIVVSAAYGSLGDLQPLLGLALELQKDASNKASCQIGCRCSGPLLSGVLLPDVSQRE